MLKGILVMSCIRPCVQLFMGLALCIADKSLGRNGQQIGMLMYPDDLCSAVIDNYGYYCLCVCLTVCWCFHLLGLVWWGEGRYILTLRTIQMLPTHLSLPWIRSLKNQHILLVEHTQVCWIISIFKTAPSLCQAYLTHITVTTMQYLQILHCMAINNEFLNSQGQASKVTFM